MNLIDVYFREKMIKISKKEAYYFHNYIFRKFEIVVCFAPLLHGVERNIFLNFDSINESLRVPSHVSVFMRRKAENNEGERDT